MTCTIDSRGAVPMVTIELLYLAPEKTWQKTLCVEQGTTIDQALQRVAWQAECPELHALPYGVFGELVSASYGLQDGDRVEFYRALSFDPTESRRRRAEHKARSLAQKQGKKSLSAAASMLLHGSKKN